MTEPKPQKAQPQTGAQGRERKAEALVRQAEALRENLAKRKQQSRARADLDPPQKRAPSGSEG